MRTEKRMSINRTNVITMIVVGFGGWLLSVSELLAFTIHVTGIQ
jgi:hypothetical protein